MHEEGTFSKLILQMKKLRPKEANSDLSSFQH